MLATAYHCRPSQILGIPDEWAAYQFDVATYTVGQGALNEAEREAAEKAKRKSKGGRGRGGSLPAGDAQPMPSSVLRGLMKP